LGNWQDFLFKGASSPSQPGYYFEVDDTNPDVEFAICDGTDKVYIDSNNFAYDTWIHFVGVINRSDNKIHLYKNGSEEGSGVDASSVDSVDSDIELQLSRTSYETDAIIDEVRISNIARSAAWIETEFNNTNDTSSFYTVGNEVIMPTNWLYRKPITINSSKVSADVINFPVLVDITDSDLSSKARSDGYDIVFTELDGRTTLLHEVENYTSSSGKLVAWVKVPSLSSSSDTVIYMYYGNSGQSSPSENPSGVWDDDFMGVWHLTESTGGTDAIKDSTSNDNDGSDSGSPTLEASGKIGNAIDFDGSDDYINCGDSTSLDILGTAMTISAWVAADFDPSNVNYDTVLDKDKYRLHFYPSITDPCWKWRLKTGSFSSCDTQDVTWDVDEWHYLTATYNGTHMQIYWDGQVNYTVSKTGNILTNDVELYIGYGEGRSSIYHYDGTIDEVRVSDVNRSAEWIETEFNNQNDTASFLYAGSEEGTSGFETQSTANFEWVELFNGGDIAINLTGWYLTDNDGNTFDLSGAGTIPVGGYLVCHLGESGSNSTTDVYGPITNSESSPLTMLENNDDLALKNNYGTFFDYLVWGADAGSDDNAAVWAGHWRDGEYVDTSPLIENQTIGLDAGSNDTNLPQDWENETGYADPFGIDRSTVNGSSPGAQNIDYIIPEFTDIFMPIIATVALFIILRKKGRRKVKEEDLLLFIAFIRVKKYRRGISHQNTQNNRGNRSS